LAKNSSTTLNNNGKSRHPSFISGFKGNSFSFSSINIMLYIGLSYKACIMLSYDPSIISSSKAFSKFNETIM
jgi:hypothetical protein